MAATMEMTGYLALLFGAYMIAAAFGMLRRPQMVDSIVQGIAKNDLLAFMMGLFVLAMGGTIVGLHDRWDTWLEAIVSLIGWAALIEGLLILAVHDLFIGLFAAIRWSHALVRAISLACMVAGAALVFAALA